MNSLESRTSAVLGHFEGKNRRERSAARHSRAHKRNTFRLPRPEYRSYLPSGSIVAVAGALAAGALSYGLGVRADRLEAEKLKPAVECMETRFSPPVNPEQLYGEVNDCVSEFLPEASSVVVDAVVDLSLELINTPVEQG